MKKNINILLILLLVFTNFAPIVNAQIITEEDERIRVHVIDSPEIGAHPTFAKNTEYFEVLDQIWINVTDHKEMDENDVFEVNKLYSYSITGKTTIPSGDIYFDIYDHYFESKYATGGGGIGFENYFSIGESYYMYDGISYDDSFENEEVYLDIDLPEIGKTPPLAKNSAKYKMIEEKWINVTDNVEMKSTDVFEKNKTYRYKSVIQTFYDQQNLYRKLGESEYFLGRSNQTYLNPEDSFMSVSSSTSEFEFYMGDHSNFVIEPGDIILEQTSAPIVNGTLISPKIIKSDKIETYYEMWYKITENGNLEYVEPGEKIEAGAIYRYSLHFTARPGYTIPDDFKIIDNYSNDNLYESNIYNSNNGPFYPNSGDYNAYYQILDEDETFNIVKPTYYIYPDNWQELKVYPNNEDNQHISWESSNEDVATLTNSETYSYDYQYIIAHKPGFTTVTATNEKGETASIEIEVCVPLESITLKEKEVTLHVGDRYIPEINFNPENAKDKRIWISAGEDYDYNQKLFSTITNGDTTSIYAHRAGKVTIRVYSNYNIEDTFELTILEKEIEVESISLNETKLDLYIDDTYQLIPTISPEDVKDKTYEWSNSNPEVVSLDKDGNVTALKEGTAIISVKTSNGKTAECEVTVSKKPLVLESIKLNKETLNLEEEISETLELIVTPEEYDSTKAEWKSSNEKVATVENGKVTAKSIGKATITVSLDGKEAKCEVTVTEKTLGIESIELDKTAIRMEVGATDTLTLTTNPEGIDISSAVWKSSNKDIVTVENGKVTALKAGNATITVTIDGKEETCKVSIYTTEEPEFKDIVEDDWYYEVVEFVSTNGIILGYEDNSFAPLDRLTRGQLVTILWRLYGEPDTSKIKNQFSDLKDQNAYFYKAVIWAADKDVVHGYNDGRFGPDDYITRQQLAVILNNYAGYVELEDDTDFDLSSFKDSDKIESYAAKAFKWAAANGVMSGNEKNGGRYISPSDNATRAEAAAMISNFVQNFELIK